MTNSVYALILAGGSGERFWPLSRRARPKQLLKLVSNKTLLEATVARLEGLVPNERILVVTNVESSRRNFSDWHDEDFRSAVSEPIGPAFRSVLPGV